MNNRADIAEILSAWSEFIALPNSEWRKDYFDVTTGGYLATRWKRIDQANKNSKEQLKFIKEHSMCLTFAKSGLMIKHFEDDKLVLFEFEEWKSETRDAISEMVRKGLHGYYFVTNRGFVHDF